MFEEILKRFYTIFPQSNLITIHINKNEFGFCIIFKTLLLWLYPNQNHSLLNRKIDVKREFKHGNTLFLLRIVAVEASNSECIFVCCIYIILLIRFVPFKMAVVKYLLKKFRTCLKILLIEWIVLNLAFNLRAIKLIHHTDDDMWNANPCNDAKYTCINIQTNRQFTIAEWLGFVLSSTNGENCGKEFGCERKRTRFKLFNENFARADSVLKRKIEKNWNEYIKMCGTYPIRVYIYVYIHCNGSWNGLPIIWDVECSHTKHEKTSIYKGRKLRTGIIRLDFMYRMWNVTSQI